jgi:hypothetical protein
MHCLQFAKKRRVGLGDRPHALSQLSPFTATQNDLNAIISSLHGQPLLRKQELSQKIKTLSSQHHSLAHPSPVKEPRKEHARNLSHISMLKKEIEHLDKENLHVDKFPKEDAPPSRQTVVGNQRSFYRPLRSVEIQLVAPQRHGSKGRLSGQERATACRFQTPKRFFRCRTKQPEGEERESANLQVKCEIIAPFRKYFQPGRGRRNGNAGHMTLSQFEAENITDLTEFTLEDLE